MGASIVQETALWVFVRTASGKPDVKRFLVENGVIPKVVTVMEIYEYVLDLINVDFCFFFLDNWEEISTFF
jgi:hypothetical protein